MANCPCGSEQSFDKCCNPYLSGKATPPTAEALMRARYTAYTRQDIEFVERTNDPKHHDPFDTESARQWAKNAKWQGLEVIHTEKGGESDTQGKVEFAAKFKMDGEDQVHHEIGNFRKESGIWYFVDGKTPGATIRHEKPAPGRNDPCPCGSGKKFKKCCG